MKTFWKNVNKSILSGITTIVIFVMGFIWWIYRPEDTVPMKVFCLTIMVSYTVCVLVYAIALGEKEVAFLLPRVKNISKFDDKLIFVVEKNELYTYNSYVTITYQENDDEIEVILGAGLVETINENGNMQVVFVKITNDKNALKILKSLNNNKKSCRAIKIKPSITKQFFEEDVNNG